MLNLVKNQHGTYTYRKQHLGSTIRASLRTKDKLEALILVEKVTEILLSSPFDSVEKNKELVSSIISNHFETLKAEQFNRIIGYLAPSENQSPLLSSALDNFYKEKIRSNSWNEITAKRYAVIYDSLIQILGDKRISELSYDDAAQVKSVLQSLPNNMNKRKEYRTKSLDQILRMDIPKEHLMSIKTINIRLSCFSDLMNWSIRQGYCNNNVFKGSMLKDSRNKKNLRLPFTPDDLNLIFNAKQIQQPKETWHYWIPLLALYTGARLNELCQLKVDDVQQYNGIWAISIDDDSEDKHLKSKSSKRLIPLHKVLLDKGFIDLVELARANNQERIFSSIKQSEGRYSHIPSKWFGRLKKQLINDNKKSFHSFRHTMVDYLHNKLKLVGNPLVKAIVGHYDDEITSGVYGASFDIEDLNKIVQAIDFKDFGLII